MAAAAGADGAERPGPRPRRALPTPAGAADPGTDTRPPRDLTTHHATTSGRPARCPPVPAAPGSIPSPRPAKPSPPPPPPPPRPPARLAQSEARPEECGPGGGGARGGPEGRAAPGGRGCAEPRGEAKGAGLREGGGATRAK